MSASRVGRRRTAINAYSTLRDPIGDTDDYQSAVAKVALLNAISLTAAQVERGYRIHLTETASNAVTLGAALRSYCESEGLHPAPIAAEAILARAYIVADALADGLDYQRGAPGMYEQIMTGPLAPADLGYVPPLEGGPQGAVSAEAAAVQAELDDCIPW